MNWFGKLVYLLKGAESRESSNFTEESIKEDCKHVLEQIQKECKLQDNGSIFKQVYELNGCFRCNLRISGFGFGNYLCDIIIMEKELAVFHLVNRSTLNVQCILAPIAATAFAKTTVKNEDTKGAILPRGEWVILPFNHILEMKLIGEQNLSVKTKNGTNYVIEDNIECAKMMLEIYEQGIENNGDKNNVFSKSNNNKMFDIKNANIPICKLEIGVGSVNDISPYSNQYPGCIVSIPNTELAEIIASDLFYGKYILDPQETFNLVISEWNEDAEFKDLEGKISNVDKENNIVTSFFLKNGSNRDIQYKKRINTGLIDIWISFKEKHKILYPIDFSYIHILIDVKFEIFEKNIGLKILIRILKLKENQSQMDIECELENISELPYLLRHQFESTTLSNIRSTVDKYISGIKTQIINNNNSISEELSIEKIHDCGNVCGIEFNVNKGVSKSISCNENMCCFLDFEKLLGKLTKHN